MEHKVWKPLVEGREHIVEFEQGDFWGCVQVKVDEALVHRSLRFAPTPGSVKFVIGGKRAILRGLGICPTEWELYVEGNLVRES